LAAVAALVSLVAVAGEPIEVGAGREKVITVPGLKRIAIDDGAIADVKTIGSDQILLQGGALGETTLHVFTKTGEKTFTVKVLAMSAQEEILNLVAAQTAAWNRGDLKAFVSAYAPDAVFVTPTGVTKGRDQVLARYQKKYPDTKAMGQLALEPVDVRAQEDAVSVAAKWTLSYPDKPAATGHTVIVFMQVTNEWRIVHDASM
jgi:uncharacterized protein (TIGR02246 family)